MFGKKQIRILAEEKRTLDAAVQFCIFSLSAKAQGESLIRQKLRDRQFSSEIIDDAVAYCIDRGYLNEVALAEQLSKEYLAAGKGAFKARQRLQTLGVHREVVAAAIQEASGSINAEEAIITVLNKRFLKFLQDPTDQKQRERMVRYFLSRGYSYRQITGAVQTWKEAAEDAEAGSSEAGL